MEQQSPAQPIIHFSRNADGSVPDSWRSVRRLTASKICEGCNKLFYPWVKTLTDGQVSYQKEKLWMKQRFCSISCSKIHSNCMASEEVRAKVSKTLRAMNHRPTNRGGNGQLTNPQLAMMEVLGTQWIAEHSVAVPGYRSMGLPKNLKIDIANPTILIAIELDGVSHQSPTRRDQDTRKVAYLVREGWSVFRITNARAIELSTTYTSAEALLTSLMEF